MLNFEYEEILRSRVSNEVSLSWIDGQALFREIDRLRKMIKLANENDLDDWTRVLREDAENS